MDPELSREIDVLLTESAQEFAKAGRRHAEAQRLFEAAERSGGRARAAKQKAIDILASAYQLSGPIIPT